MEVRATMVKKFLTNGIHDKLVGAGLDREVYKRERERKIY